MAEVLTRPELLATYLDAERPGLLTDCDGTISAIAVRPEAAIVSPTARAALAALAKRLPLVGAVSGRALFDLRRLIDLPDLLYIGSHGLTWWYRGQDEMPEEALPYVEQTPRAAADLSPLRRLPGIRFEEKGVGLAIHYRLAADPAVARETILRAVAASEAACTFELREGIRVVELYPRIKVNKGTALRRVVERFELDSLLFFGDDLTDVDAMYAATELRSNDGVRIATVAVRHAEAPPITAETADWVVDGIAGTEQVLEWLAGEAERRWAGPTYPPGPPP